MEIAVYGGSFNPPTRAHEAIIGACLEDPRFDQVWVMPSGERRDKPDMLDDYVRLEMLDLVKKTCFDDDPRLKIDDFEIELAHYLNRPSQTLETVRELNRCYPEHDFSFVFGADSYQDMPNWRGGKVLQQKLGMLIVPRAGYELPPETARVRHLDCSINEEAAICSTEVRAAVRSGKNIGRYVCSGIEEFVAQRGLYQSNNLAPALLQLR